MNSHFKFTKKQRNGIFLLASIILFLQIIYFFIELPKGKSGYDHLENDEIIKQIDSLKELKIASNKTMVKTFNPNFITDYKGYNLGMSNQQIDRLLAYRNKNKWINSAQQFQEITQISDSLLQVISPYFKFPEWITNPKEHDYLTNKYNGINNSIPSIDSKQDLNLASAEQLQEVNGIGAVLSDRIIRFRNKFPGGFIADIQLQDVYGLTPETIEKITHRFTVKTPRPFIKINLNTAKLDDLVTVQHIDYELASEIIEYRTLINGYKSLDELTKVKGFPASKLEIIRLYLSLEKEN